MTSVRAASTSTARKVSMKDFAAGAKVRPRR